MVLREWEEIRKIIRRTHYFSVRKSGRRKLQGAVIVDQTRAESDTQLRDKKEQWRRQLKISSNHMYRNISSMQNTSKLLQCTQAATLTENEAFTLKSQSISASSPKAAALTPPQQWDWVHRCQGHRVSPPGTVIVWLSENMTGKAVSRRLPEQAALQQTWTSWDHPSRHQEPEHRLDTMTEFNIFLEAFIISTAT